MFLLMENLYMDSFTSFKKILINLLLLLYIIWLFFKI